ncbi:MAG: adenylosuccinate lyase [Bacteroidetes bacterium GWC2_33_15]|nr:MAG: adenylosuccinate lyase [Bacteroidetes bacterium GWA2_33_15]OFX51077.1 MAG: adenylosuccinate lyase [Bacteroidetes bacterium GWC2_33_15]OFX66490.1 MAG: adenylosuccinate lyase [Bacteroidetes bacterium GWB2_32_14]OFX70285.1 MAG: adenylosuccinate lyase [Bacteroidetes bacterium GWD2_33_33]HAN17282.1 adenylosuccinate lyase [Bacteroidales bacterium]
MTIDTLSSISPVDGRYRNKTEELAPYFSELGLIRYRVLVEIEYFIALCELPLPQLNDFNKDIFQTLRKVYTDFSITDAQKIKEIEKVTNHDVKAVEYFLKDKFEALELNKYIEFIHFGLTSQDINNTATPYSIREALEKVYYPNLDEVLQKLKKLASEWKDIPMLARTHGQPASPTRLGKEINVFIERLEIQINQLKQIPFSAKFGGATGNFNAHYVAYPQIDWVKFGNQFVNSSLKLNRSQTTTQIEHYDNLAAMFDAMKRVNTIFIDLSRDFWTYISLNYFKQKVKKGEVGSSAMPHKVNPIDFENAEGNLGLANAIFEHLSAKLPVSRLQRDLTDSTVIRNVGVPISHTLIAFKSLVNGLEKVIVNEQIITNDLNENWAVVAEAIQTILRREGYSKPYEALKELTRTGDKITKESIYSFIEKLNLSATIKEELKSISPFNYTGI